jgi:hypothetical protein
MEVTDLKLFVSSGGAESGVGYGSIQFSDFMWINIGIKKAGTGRLFVTWPAYKKKDGTYGQDVRFFGEDQERVKSQLKQIEDYILEEFGKKMVIPVVKEVSKKQALVQIKVKDKTSVTKPTLQQTVEEGLEDDDALFDSAIHK